MRSTPQPSSIPFLSEEVIFNILVFLPADILYNVMRYVCREWYKIINNPSFINAHFEKLTKCLIIQCLDNREVIDFVETNNDNDNDNVGLRKLRYGFSNRILSSCDGLVLFCDDRNKFQLCVANIATNQILTLPPLFEPIVEYRSLPVLVYVNSIRRYKVVHVFPVMDMDGQEGIEFKCAILTVGAETEWRLIDTKHIPNTDRYFMEVDSTLSAGGYVYWTPEFRGCVYLAPEFRNSTYFLALDVEDEIMHKFPNPRFVIGEGGYFIVRESFLTFMFNDDDMKFFWKVFALTELNTGGEWTWLFKIDLIGQSGFDEIHCRLHPKICDGCNLYPLAWLKNGELVIFRDSIPSTTFIVYNIKTGQLSSFSAAKNGTYINYYFHAHVNSLVSLKTPFALLEKL